MRPADSSAAGGRRMRRRRADRRDREVRRVTCRGVAGKRRGPGPAAFLANLETEVLALERELRAGTWRPGGYVSFEIRDPKRRTISAAPFRDRVVHHAVHAVIVPLFERGFIDHTYANPAGKGTHRGLARYERLRDRHRHVLRGDIYRYFPAIDYEVLKADLRRRIACRPPLAVLDRIVDASNPQVYYPGDDLFTPFERHRGLPIGQPDGPALRQRVPRPLRPLRHRGAPRPVSALRRRLRAVPPMTRRGSRCGVPAGFVPGLRGDGYGGRPGRPHRGAGPRGGRGRVAGAAAWTSRLPASRPRSTS